ncbi:MAG TPA: hypothetical protein VH951_06405 [Dehalococcoidia bacterium]|jgi:hypothetical protein
MTNVAKKLTDEQRANMTGLVAGLGTKAAKIHKLYDSGYEKARIAEFLDIRYQHVRNVLTEHPAASTARPDEPPTRPDFGACVLESDGRISLPTAALASLSAAPGDSLPWRFDGDELVIMGRDAGLKFAQSLAAAIAQPGVSFTEMLCADREMEAAREASRDARG